MEEFKDPLEGTPKAATKYAYGNNLSHFDKICQGTKFMENGLWGLNAPDGTVLYPAKYVFIFRCKSCAIFLEPNGNSFRITGGCAESGYMPKEDRPYVKDGKAGFKVGRKVIIPAEYDFLEKEFGDTIFYAAKDGREMYLDTEGREVLTRVRRFEGENLSYPPFRLRTNYFDIITAMKYVGAPNPDDPNVGNLDGEWGELDRYSKDEIMQMLIDPTDDLPLTEQNLSELCSRFSYEYSFYVANAKGKAPLAQCMEQLRNMDAFDRSWYYVVKIWQAPGQQLTASDLRQFDRALRNSEIIGTPLYAIGHHKDLKEGEVRMLFITHYNERCFPPKFEFEWFDKCATMPITELMQCVPELRQNIQDDVLTEYQAEYFNALIDCLTETNFYPDRQSWDETKQALDYFYAQGSPVKRAVWYFIHKALENSQRHDMDAVHLSLQATLWAIEKGGNVHECNNKTSVRDIADQLDVRNELVTPVYLRLLSELQERQAKPYAAMVAERDANDDYFTELNFLRR